MGKLIESTLVSADGVIGDPPLWAMEYRDEDVQADALDRLAGSEALLLGRGTYDLFAATWPGQAGDFADRMNGIRKYVFSSTLDRAEWNNSAIVRGDAVEAVARLKEETGRELAIFGHGQLTRALWENGLVDEMRLSIHPVRVGSGKLLFTEGKKTGLTLLGSKVFRTGVVVLRYQPLYGRTAPSKLAAYQPAS